MRWNKVNLAHERHNGLLFKVATTTPTTTPPKLLDSILEAAGVRELSDKEFRKLMRDEGLEVDMR